MNSKARIWFEPILVASFGKSVSSPLIPGVRINDLPIFNNLFNINKYETTKHGFCMGDMGLECFGIHLVLPFAGWFRGSPKKYPSVLLFFALGWFGWSQKRKRTKTHCFLFCP